MRDFEEGARLFNALAQHILSFYDIEPKRHIPQGKGWTNKRRFAYAEQKLAEHWRSMRLVGEVSRHIAFLCKDLDELQTQIRS